MSSTTTAPRRNRFAAMLGLVGMSGIAGVLVAVLVTPLITVLGFTANSTIGLFNGLPNYLAIQPLQQKTELYGIRGDHEEKFAEFYSQNRIEVPLDQVSPYVIDALISTEDPRFYEHGGVDVISATRALTMMVLSDSEAGASTITMQYVRNMRTQAAEAIQDPDERAAAYKEATDVSATRKLQEMRLAIGVEQQYTKDEILQGYLNISLFGGQIYGIESAAQYYFGKSAKDLEVQEAASLIAMVQNPNFYRIDKPEGVEANKGRRDYVLGNMRDKGKIDETTYDAAVAAPVEPHITPAPTGCMNAGGNAQYFCDYVRRVVLNDPAFGADDEERLRNFQTKGYQIHTTIDLDLQDQAQASMSAAVPGAINGIGREHRAARHRQNPLDGAEQALRRDRGGRERSGRDVGELQHRPEVRRIDGLPGRVDVQDLHAHPVARERPQPQRVGRRRDAGAEHVGVHELV